MADPFYRESPLLRKTVDMFYDLGNKLGFDMEQEEKQEMSQKMAHDWLTAYLALEPSQRRRFDDYVKKALHLTFPNPVDTNIQQFIQEQFRFGEGWDLRQMGEQLTYGGNTLRGEAAMAMGRGITFSKPRSARVAPAPAPAPAPPAPIPITPAEVRRIAKAVGFDITDARYFYRPHVKIPISEYVRRLRVAVEKGMDVTDIFATYQWEEPPAPIPTEEERERRRAARAIVSARQERRNRDIQSELEDDIAQRIRWGPGEWRNEYTETLGRGHIFSKRTSRVHPLPQPEGAQVAPAPIDEDSIRIHIETPEEHKFRLRRELERRKKAARDKARGKGGAPLRYPASVQASIDKYGDYVINKVMVKRHGIPHFIQEAAKALSTTPFDKLYHLGLLVDLRNSPNPPVTLQIDKNATVYVGKPKDRKSDDERIVVATPNPPTTLREFLDRGLEAMGADRFFRYSAFQHNCQDFVSGLLQANNISSPDVQDFVLQDVSSLLEEMPDWVEPVTQAITDTQAQVEMVGNGNVCMRAIAGVSLDDIEEGRRQRALREARRVGHPVRVAPLSEPMEIPAGRQAPLSEYPAWGIYHQDMSVQNPRALPPPRGYRRGSDPGTGYGAPIRYAHMGRSFFR